MNSESFWAFSQLGFEHILDPKGIDHVVFLMVLVAIYQFKNWKPLLFAVTAFTIGHSITLASAPQDFIKEWQGWIEWGIPTTIFLTGLINIIRLPSSNSSVISWLIAGIFGLVHGLGFGNFFHMLTAGSENIILDLIPFTLGIETGQIVAVIALLLLSWIFRTAFNLKERDWTLFISGLGMGMALFMMLERWP